MAAPRRRPRRGFALLDPAGVAAVNPAVRGGILGGLHCARDASVEPGQVLGALRAHLATTRAYRWLPGRTAVDLDGTAVRDHTGACTAATWWCWPPARTSPAWRGGHLSAAPIRRCRLQMMQTAPLGEELTTAIADGDSFRYYPAYRAGRPRRARHRRLRSPPSTGCSC